MTTPFLSGTPVPVSEPIAPASVRTICAWCLEEGVTTMLQEGAAPEPVSHGCCPRHAALILQEAGLL